MRNSAVPMSPESADIRAIIVFGVAGVGKTSVARRLAEHLGFAFADADDHHDDLRIAQMSAGIPLTDEDRWDWLRRLRALIDEAADRGQPIVLACSALKAAYREVLDAGEGTTLFVELSLPERMLEQRIAAREGHFMPASLLHSQLEAFEPLTEGERARGSFAVSAVPGVDAIVDATAARIGGTAVMTRPRELGAPGSVVGRAPAAESGVGGR